MLWKNHTFVVCAYGDSPYLEECLRSLTAQTLRSRLLLVTSTPSTYIESCARRFDIPYVINTGESGIAGDWNFAYESAQTKYVTIAHQDDCYDPNYLSRIYGAARKHAGARILFTDYDELRGSVRQSTNTLLRIKRVLLAPLRLPGAWRSRKLCRLSIAFGNPICCPAVTYHKALLPERPFASGMKSNLDWQLWEALTRDGAGFVYLPGASMCHRIHEGSTTTKIIGESLRTQEDSDIFRLLWPEPVAGLLGRFYQKSEASNRQA